jgi:asparagine synthase (glutamine-hydrolysing)
MCGIAGIFKLNSEKIIPEEISRFTDSMKHRGPDGSGYELLENGSLALGHRRLSILDLSEQGHQPMYYEGRFCITYNGEVYNFQEVRESLQAKGHSFKSATDTEVILAAYKEWGKDCLNRFNGMWAFAIWDKEKKQLFLSRDRFGIKPLYYVFKPNEFFAFASETRAFKYLNGFKRQFDEELLRMNMVDPYALEGAGYTPFKNVLQLLPGHYMVLKKDETPRQKRWWHIKDHLSKSIPDSIEEQARKFYEIFRDACRIRLISDVPVGTALSGGLDSTAVYCTVSDIIKSENLQRFNKDSQRAFTAIFPGLPDDEQVYAKKAAEYTGGPIELIETDFKNLESQITHDTELGDFIAGAPLTAIAAVYAGMRKNGIVVSLDGHGVDEMLFGYRDMVYSLYNDALWDGSYKDAVAYADILQCMYPVERQEEMRLRFNTELHKKKKRDGNIIYLIKKMFRQPVTSKQYLPAALKPLSDSPYDFSGYPLPERMRYYEFFQHTLPALLRNFDRAGMMNSIEIRMPFMDWRLVSYVFSLPVASGVGLGFTKLILRKAMQNNMPEELRLRTFKVGIGSPTAYWFNGELKGWMVNSAEDPLTKSSLKSSIESGGVSPALIKKAWQEINKKIINENSPNSKAVQGID